MVTPRKPILDLYRRGNTTSGSARKGYKGGRKGSYPKGTLTHTVHSELSEEHAALAVMLGNGNITEGIRRALRTCEKPDFVPDSRYAAEQLCKKDKYSYKRALRDEQFARAMEERFGVPAKGVPAPTQKPAAPIDWDDM